MAKKKREDKRKKTRDLLFLACFFIGLGVGMGLGYTGIGALIGLGVGFLAAFIYEISRKKR